MKNLNYNSDSDKNDEYILEDDDDDEVGYDSANDDKFESKEMNDLDFIASYAVDLPLFDVSNHIPQSVVTSAPVNSIIAAGDNDDSEDEVENDMKVENAESSSSSDSDSEDEVLSAEQRKSRFGGKLTSMLTEEEDEDQTMGPPRTKNEILETVLYPDNGVKVTAQDVLVNIGEVMYRIDHECVVVVQAKHTTHPLNEGSVLCSDKGVVLGRIHEVFGPITTPFYVVRWNGKSQQAGGQSSGKQSGVVGGGNGKNSRGNRGNRNKHEAGGVESVDTSVGSDVGKETRPVESESSVQPPIGESATAVADVLTSTDTVINSTPAEVRSVQQVNELFVPGTAVFMVQSHSSFVTPGVLIQQHGKGSDASNAYDEEPPEEELEYSDDEQEMLARQARNRTKRAGRADTGNNNSDRQREGRQQSRVPSYSHNSNTYSNNNTNNNSTGHSYYGDNTSHQLSDNNNNHRPMTKNNNGGGGVASMPTHFPIATTSSSGSSQGANMLFSPSGVYLGPSPSFNNGAAPAEASQMMMAPAAPQFQNMQYPMQQPQQQQYGGIPFQPQYPAQYPQQPQYGQYQQQPWPGFNPFPSQPQQQQQYMMPTTQYAPYPYQQQQYQQQYVPTMFGAPAAEPQYRHQPIQQQINSALFALPGQQAAIPADNNQFPLNNNKQ